ncbi:hypothetical protein [Phytoactinopolyspora endophytica]|nr:hypothetical protein [Phytoactinopolyspora endophytica]
MSSLPAGRRGLRAVLTFPKGCLLSDHPVNHVVKNGRDAGTPKLLWL